MPWRASPDSRTKCDAIYHRTLRFLYDNASRDGQSPREYAPGEIAHALGYTEPNLLETQKIIGYGLQKFLKRGLIEWNHLYQPRRRYWMEPKHFVGAEAQLALFEAAENPVRDTSDDAPCFVQASKTEIFQRSRRRW